MDLRHQATERVIGVYLIETTDGPALVDCGPTVSIPELRRGLADRGLTLTDVHHLLLTHIHLDHAGAAWRFARHGARIYAHPLGAPHLIDPSKLWASATRIYGDQTEPLWGRAEPIPPEQVVVLEDNQTVRFGPLEIQALETPGHAPHHLAYRVEDAVFTGDVAGVRIGPGPVLPPCPPPDIHVEQWQRSIARLRDLSPARLYLTHFGPYTDVREHLDQLEAKLLEYAGWIRDRLRQGLSQEQIVPQFEQMLNGDLERFGLDQEGLADYEKADPAWMSVAGLSRYWQKHHPEALQ
ncbi:MAG: MBL fold hydrolase [Meiothermus sp.]